MRIKRKEERKEEKKTERGKRERKDEEKKRDETKQKKKCAILRASGKKEPNPYKDGQTIEEVESSE